MLLIKQKNFTTERKLDSKLCSNCGYKFNELTLDIREWTCPSCKTKLDRDVNAAINILNEGLSITCKK